MTLRSLTLFHFSTSPLLHFVLTLSFVPAATVQFTAGIDLVEVYATVTDREGRPVAGLERADFRVLEDGQPREVTVFAAGDFPLAVAVAIDRSWSMAGRPLALAHSAALRFLEGLRPSDRSMVLVIGGETTVLAPLSTDRAAQLAAVAGLEPWGTTRLYDTILDGLDAIAPGDGRRALVMLSDGDERYSVATAADVAARARTAGVLIYPVAVGRTRPPLFAGIAALSGGRSFHATDPAALGEILVQITQELRHQYLLGYVPARAASPAAEWRSIHVEVNRPGVRVRARQGYLYRPSSRASSRQASPSSNVAARRRFSPQYP